MYILLYMLRIQYEAIVMQDVIDPDDINTSFDDIADVFKRAFAWL